MKNYKQTILEANEKINKTSAFILAARQEYREEQSKIRSDRRLSEDAKREDMAELKKNAEKVILQHAQEMRRDYEAPLRDLIKQAEAELAKALPKVDANKQTIFTREIENMKAKAIFALDQKARIKMLEQLVSMADEPALADQAKSIFLELSSQVLNDTKNFVGNEVAEMRHLLGSMYEQLEQTARVEGAEEAQQAIESAKNMLGSAMFNSVSINAISEVSEDTAKYINDPDAYFEKNGE